MVKLSAAVTAKAASSSPGAAESKKKRSSPCYLHCISNVDLFDDLPPSSEEAMVLAWNLDVLNLPQRSLFKSGVQKSVRLSKADSAARLVYGMLAAGSASATDLIRRLPIVAVEDATTAASTAVFVWLMCAMHGAAQAENEHAANALTLPRSQRLSTPVRDWITRAVWHMASSREVIRVGKQHVVYGSQPISMKELQSKTWRLLESLSRDGVFLSEADYQRVLAMCEL